MQILTPSRLTMIMHRCPKLMKDVATKLTLDTDPQYAQIVKEFTKAFEAYDVDTVNSMLTESITRYLGKDNVLEGLQNYCERYGISIDVTSMSQKQLIYYIADHKNDILSEIKSKEV